MFNLEDIGIALSRIPRFGGHTSRFYSVLEHSVYCYWEAKEREYDKDTQRLCLAHDWSEAYVIDIPKPLKQQLPKYVEIEDNIQDFIYMHYKVFGNEKQMKAVDTQMCCLEARHLMKSQGKGERWPVQYTGIVSAKVMEYLTSSTGPNVWRDIFKQSLKELGFTQ